MADDTRDTDMGMRDEDTMDPAYGDTGMTEEDTDKDMNTGV